MLGKNRCELPWRHKSHSNMPSLPPHMFIYKKFLCPFFLVSLPLKLSLGDHHRSCNEKRYILCSPLHWYLSVENVNAINSHGDQRTCGHKNSVHFVWKEELSISAVLLSNTSRIQTEISQVDLYTLQCSSLLKNSMYNAISLSNLTN